MLSHSPVLANMKFEIDLSLLLPQDPAFQKSFSYLLLFTLAVLCIGILARLFMGKKNNLNVGIFGGLSVLVLYAIAAVFYALLSDRVSTYLNCLPLGTFVSDQGQLLLKLKTYSNLSFSEICGEYFQVFLLSYIVCWCNVYTPGNMNAVGWTGTRLLFLVLSIGIYYGLVGIVGRFIPDFLKHSQLAVVLLSILGFSIVMGLCKQFLAIFQKQVGMLYDGFHNYFFKNKFGVHMVQAVASVGVVMSFVRVLEIIDHHQLPVGLRNLGAYLPISVVIFILWLIFGRTL